MLEFLENHLQSRGVRTSAQLLSGSMDSSCGGLITLISPRSQSMLWQIFVILGLRTRTGIIVVVRSIPARLHRVLHQPITRRTSTSWYTSIESFSRRWLQFNSMSRILLKLCSRGWATRVSRRRRWWWWWYAICSRDIPTIQHPSTHYSHREESSSEWMKVRRHPPTHPWNPFLHYHSHCSVFYSCSPKSPTTYTVCSVSS